MCKVAAIRRSLDDRLWPSASDIAGADRAGSGLCCSGLCDAAGFYYGNDRPLCDVENRFRYGQSRIQVMAACRPATVRRSRLHSLLIRMFSHPSGLCHLATCSNEGAEIARNGRSGCDYALFLYRSACSWRLPSMPLAGPQQTTQAAVHTSCNHGSIVTGPDADTVSGF